MSYEPKPNGSSPWGSIQHVQCLFDGVWQVGTSGHGGIKLSRQRNARVPAFMRRDGGWYEEDCDWCIPAVVFLTEWLAWSERRGVANERANIDGTFVNWHPDEYAEWHRVPLESLAGRSRCYDQRVFDAKHASDFLVLSACGDWHERCPQGYVLVTASVGGNRSRGVAKRTYLVPEEEYDNRGRFGFVVDTEKHQEMG